MACIGYRNIVLHVGVNDIREGSPGRLPEDPAPHDIKGHFDNFIDKVTHIQKLCPKSRLVISPILPTKSRELNNRAGRFNSFLRDYVINFNSQIKLLNGMEFLSRQGLLAEELGVYKKPYDEIHLGKHGIRLLAKTIKEGIFNF